MEMRSIILLVTGFLILTISHKVNCRTINGNNDMANEVQTDAVNLFDNWVKIVTAPKSKLVQPLDSVLELECEVMGSPAPVIQWISGTTPPITTIDNYETNTIDEKTTGSLVRVRSILRIDHILPNERVYTCIGRSGNKIVMASTTVYPSNEKIIKTKNLSDLLQLTDIALPGIKNARVIYNHKFVLDLMGANIYLPCEATGRPQPEIYWMNSDGIITGRDPRFKILPDGKLLISNLKWSDMGVYKCVARNPSGKDVAETFVYPALRED